ncbi:MAG: methionine gamma-lyase family protein, partial [Clostridia bacterium]|nr:methionine gamma-lyase family protein [Clostridia bacterium]
LREKYGEVEEIKKHNQSRVLRAFRQGGVKQYHFHAATGYGYGDEGRQVLDRTFAGALEAEDCLVRAGIVSGTHAVSLCYFGLLRPGDELVSVTGKPYETLEKVIGLDSYSPGCLRDWGIKYRQVELTAEGKPDLGAIRQAITPQTKVVSIQRSRGYAWRPSLAIDDIADIIKAVKQASARAICFVDNCYGEFVEEKEPVAVGADLMAGSLLKNPGGTLAPSGGYIAGKASLVEACAARFTAPGLGRDVGASLCDPRILFQGLFLAPIFVAEAVKAAMFIAAFMQALGFEVSPGPQDKRTDIIQAVRLGSAELMVSFMEALQKASPVDAHLIPEPAELPGYEVPVIMAGGTFVAGATLEFSADAPVAPPYAVYIQGGVDKDYARLMVVAAAEELWAKRLIKL